MSLLKYCAEGCKLEVELSDCLWVSLGETWNPVSLQAHFPLAVHNAMGPAQPRVSTLLQDTSYAGMPYAPPLTAIGLESVFCLSNSAG